MSDPINWKSASILHASVPLLSQISGWRSLLNVSVFTSLGEDSIEARESSLHHLEVGWGGIFQALRRGGVHLKLCLAVDKLNRAPGYRNTIIFIIVFWDWGLSAMPKISSSSSSHRAPFSLWSFQANYGQGCWAGTVFFFILERTQINEAHFLYR